MTTEVTATGLANGQHGKDFAIRVKADGDLHVFTAKRQPNGKYSIRLGLFDHDNLLLREAKDAALMFVTGSHEPQDNTAADEGPKALWSCVAPCALVAELLAVAEAYAGRHEDFDKVKKIALITLDCYGFLCEDGTVDGERVRREFEIGEIK